MDVKGQIIEKTSELSTSPIAQKVVPLYSMATGGAVSFEVIQGWAGVVSAFIGIIAGLLVVFFNYKKGKVASINADRAEAEKRKAEAEERKAEIEEKIKQHELDMLRMKSGMDDDD